MSGYPTMYPRVGIGDLCYNHCDSKLVYCDFSRVRFFLRLCATQKRYVAILCDPKKVCCNTSAQPKTILRLCATQKRFVATLEEPCRYLQLMFRSNRPKLGISTDLYKKMCSTKNIVLEKMASSNQFLW